MPVLLSSVVMLCVIGAAGVLVSSRGLRLENPLLRIATAAAIAIALPAVLLNAAGYAFPSHVALPVVFAAILALTLALLVLPKQRGWISVSWRTYLVLAAIALLGGAAYARTEISDAITPEHYVVPATVIAGNLPVRDPVNPGELLAYHYAGELHAAFLSWSTGMEVTTAFAIQALLAAVAIVFACAGMGMELTRTERGAILSGALGFAAAGLFWIAVFPFARAFLVHLLMDVPLPEGAWPVMRMYTEVIRNISAQSLVATLNHRPIALGASCALAMLPLVTGMVHAKASIRLAWPIAVFLVLASALALTSETTFVLAMGAIGLLACWSFFRRETRRGAVVLLILCAVAAVVAFVQGGVLTAALHSTTYQSFAFKVDGSFHLEADGTGLPLFSMTFLRDFGLHVLLLGIALYGVRKKLFADTPLARSIVMLLVLLAALHLAVPFFFTFVPRPNELKRLIYIAFCASSVLIGASVASLTSRVALSAAAGSVAKRAGHVFLYCCVAAMLVAGTLNALTRLAFPTLRLQAAPLLPPPPLATEEQQNLHAWVRRHTTLDDLFYLHLDTDDYINDLVRFGYYTGRFVIGHSVHRPGAVTAQIDAIERDCNAEAFSALNVRYLVLENERRHQWFEDICGNLEAALVYDGGAGDQPWPRVYRMR